MATRSISTQIRVSGEKEFNKAMSSINSNLRTLNSALGASEAAFRAQGNTVDGMRSKLKAQKDLYAEQARGIAELEKAMQGVEKGSQTYNNYETSLNRAKTAHYNLSAEIQKTEQELKDAEKATDSMGDAAEDMSESIEQSNKGISAWGVAVGNILADLARKGVDVVKSIAKTGIQYNAEMEKYTSSMTTALGSSEAAAKAIAAIKIDAAMTPYGMATLVQANQLLISTGESATDARKTIMALSNAVSATGGGNDELLRMSQNLQQIKNTGKAASIDIKQFAMAGIDIYGILADYTGKTTQEVKDLDVSYQLLSKALQASAEEGGRFYGANEAQAKTMNGQISTLTDNVKSKLGEAFQGVSDVISGTLLPAANDFVNGLDVPAIIQDFEDLIPVVATVSGAIAAIKVADGLMDFAKYIDQVKDLYGQLDTTKQAARLLNDEVPGAEKLVAVMTGSTEKAAAGQALWNAAINAFPGALLATAVIATVEGVRAYNNVVKEAKENELGDILKSDNIDEVGTKLSSLKDRYAALNKARDDYWKSENAAYNTTGFTDYDKDIDATRAAIKELEEHYASLEAVQLAQQEAEKKQAAYMETTAGKVEALTTQIEDLTTAYAEAYAAARESLQGQFDLFEKVKEVQSISVDDMIDALASQRDYYNSYRDNLSILQSMTGESIGLSKDLVANLGDGSADSVQYVQSIVQAYQNLSSEAEKAEFVSSLNTAFSEQQQALDEAAEAMAEYQTEFSAKMEELVNTAKEGANGMNQEVAMSRAATSSLQAFIDACSSMEKPLADKAAALAAGFSSAFNDNVILSAGIAGGGRALPGHASGLDYVPYDDYVARLHKGEMVLTAKEAEAFRHDGKENRVPGQTVNKTVELNVYPRSLDAAQVDYLVETVNRELGKA